MTEMAAATAQTPTSADKTNQASLHIPVIGGFDASR